MSPYCLPGIPRKPMPIKERIELIIQSVCDSTGIGLDEIAYKSKKSEIVEARRLAIYFLRRFTELNQLDIAHLVGCKDHTTVIHHLHTIRDFQDIGDPRTMRLINKINQSFPLWIINNKRAY